MDEFEGSANLVTFNGQPLPLTTSAFNVVGSLEKGVPIVSPKGELSLVTSGT